MDRVSRLHEYSRMLLDLEDGRHSDWVESIGPLNLQDGRRSDWVESIGPLNLEDMAA